MFGESYACFYADDGLLQNKDPQELQRDLNSILNMFCKMGLKPNATKTKFMICRGDAAPIAMKREAYDRIRRTQRNATVLSNRRE